MILCSQTEKSEFEEKVKIKKKLKLKIYCHHDQLVLLKTVRKHIFELQGYHCFFTFVVK